MAIKVLIERKVKAGYEVLVWNMLRDLRSQTVRRQGYLYGETWRSLDNPRIFLVSSTWGSREYWDAWSNDEYRKQVELRISAFLRKAHDHQGIRGTYHPPGSNVSNIRWQKRRRILIHGG